MRVNLANLTLRKLLAMAAMAGLCADSQLRKLPSSDPKVREMAALAYAIADEIIEGRNT